MVAPERWELHLTAAQLSAIEYLTKSEIGAFSVYFRDNKSCWSCGRQIDPDAAEDGHEAACVYLAVVELANMVDRE